MIQELPRQELGRTGAQVTRLGYGGREIGGAVQGRPATEEESQRILNLALDSGINFFDTSIDYGLSETRIGRYISHRRQEFLVATKCGCRLDAPQEKRPTDLRLRLRPLLHGTFLWRAAKRVVPSRYHASPAHIYTAENINAGVKQSLERLQTDYVDLLQFHGHPSRLDLEADGALDAVLELKRQGIVRFAGVSAQLPEVLEHIETGVFDTFQVPYSALQPEHEPIIERIHAAGAGTIIRGAGSQERPRRDLDQPLDSARLAVVDELRGHVSRMEFMLRYTLSLPAVDTAIVGTLSPRHLQENVEAVLRGPLDSGLYDAAQRRLSAVDSNAMRGD